MSFRDKIEILLRRKGYRKTEFADKLGITYRALANYLSGSRSPRAVILKKMCEELDVSEEFLLDEKQSLILNSEERFFQNASDESLDTEKALELLKDAKRIFQGRGLTPKDKQSLFSCLSEIYFSAANSRKQETSDTVQQ